VKSFFITPKPQYELEDEFEDTHRLLADFVYFSELLDQTITVPKDFITDFASVPRLVGVYLLFGNRGKRAAILHDWMYSNPGLFDRKLADDLFHEALLVSGYSHFTAALMYEGVRKFGWTQWKEPNVPQEPQVKAVMYEVEAP
jgi:hypothetical protein